MAAIGAIVAAAGRSTRMGQPKQLLPWRDASARGTVLGTVIQNLTGAGASPVVCVVGHLQQEIGAIAQQSGAEVLVNPDYAVAEMLVSWQVGARYLYEHMPSMEGALFALGDQPHIPIRVIRQVVHHALCRPHAIVIPSFAMRRGHPMILPRDVWVWLMDLEPEQSMRDVLRHFAERVEYVNVGSDAILQDMDTPEDYAALAPEGVSRAN